MKHIPLALADLYLKDPKKKMLMASPTHAFIFLPGLEPFCKGWQDTGFTYTWVRDHCVEPQLAFYHKIQWGPEEQRYGLELLAQALPPQIAHLLHRGVGASEESLSPLQWREGVVASLNVTGATKIFIENRVDAFLVQHLPFIPMGEVRSEVMRLMPLLQEVDVVVPRGAMMTAYEVRELAKACWLKRAGSLLLQEDLHLQVMQKARELGLAPPSPLLFADTNWTGAFFGWLVNPGTEKLELWRLDRTGCRGAPMSSWKTYMDGTQRKPWSIYTNPFEYR
jgi:hypothetical protein